MNMLQIVVAFIATALGLYYAALGFSAIKHLRSADQIDKAIGWSLWWCLDQDRYSEQGRKLCKKGLLVALASIALWIVVYFVAGE